MDYYKCERCGKIFDEFAMNYKAAQTDKKCLCNECRAENEHTAQPDQRRPCKKKSLSMAG